MFSMLPIGRVACPRTEAIDDDWGEIVSRVILDGERFTAESLQGLGEFSHVDVVYVFDQVDPDSYEVGARVRAATPSGRWFGVFAQRNKRRPNRIGVCTCELLEVNGTT